MAWWRRARSTWVILRRRRGCFVSPDWKWAIAPMYSKRREARESPRPHGCRLSPAVISCQIQALPSRARFNGQDVYSRSPGLSGSFPGRPIWHVRGLCHLRPCLWPLRTADAPLPACEPAMIDKYIYVAGIRSREFDVCSCFTGKCHHLHEISIAQDRPSRRRLEQAGVVSPVTASTKPRTSLFRPSPSGQPVPKFPRRQRECDPVSRSCAGHGL